MSETPDDTPDEKPAAPPAEAPRRGGTPGAAAASRARRIGGRPAAGRPTPAGSPRAGETAPRPTSLTKSAPAADEPVDPPAPDPAPGDAPGRPSLDGTGPAVPAWLNWAPAGVLVAGCVVMAVLLLVFSHGVWWGPDPAAPPSQSQVNQKREQVMAAAKSCVVAANDYDYRTLAAYEKRALACTTGGLTSRLKQTIESLIMKNAPQIKAKQSTQINRGGIETVTPDGKQWTLLLFGQLSVVNANYPKGRVDPFGAEVRMEKAHGKWVMSQLTVVSSPLQSS